MTKFKYFSFALILILGTLISCDKDDSNDLEEIPGEIPGMGNAGGELQVIEPFVLPDGISIVGEIKGIGDATVAIEGGISLFENSRFKDYVPAIGSGGQWIALDLILENASPEDVEVIFHKGCVFECQTEGYQHGVLLQNVRIKALGNGKQIQIKLFLYCINKGKHGSSHQVTYVIKGVSTSEWIAKLVEALEYKKIDVSDFTPEEMEEYDRICNGIQDIVWAITNGYGVNKKDWDFINALQDKIVEHS